jgi:hypothetical protein
MKILTTILLPFAFVLTFGLMPTASLFACGDNGQACTKVIQKETTEKSCCKKEKKSKKSCSKGKCCCDNCKGDCSDNGCQCPVPTTILADLPKRITLIFSINKPIFIQKNLFSYQQISSKSSIQDIWQPPITVLSI